MANTLTAEDAINTLVNEILGDFQEEYTDPEAVIIAAYLIDNTGEIHMFYPKPDPEKTVDDLIEMAREDMRGEAKENDSLLAVAIVTDCQFADLEHDEDAEPKPALCIEVENVEGYSETVFRTYEVEGDNIVWSTDLSQFEKELEFFTEA